MKFTETVISPNQSSRDGAIPRIIVLHICDGYYDGTKGWFKMPASQTSSHFIVAKDGRVCQCVPLERMAWCNGTGTGDKSPSLSKVPIVRELGGNANRYSISIECEGLWKETQGALTEVQLETVVCLIEHICDEVNRIWGRVIDLDRQHIVGHFEITPRTRANCPGEKFPWTQLIARLNRNKVQSLYRIQAGAFLARSDAELFLKEQLLAKGVQAHIVETADASGKTLWRVQIGAFSGKDNATKYLSEMRLKGIEAFIVVSES